MAQDASCETRLLGRDDPDFVRALRLIVSSATGSEPDADRRVSELLRIVESRGLTLDLVFGAFQQGKLAASCVGVESPGRMALVYLPPRSSYSSRSASLVAALQALQACAWERSIVILQALVSPEDAASAAVLKRGGFRFLAELAYQDCLIATAPDSPRRCPGLRFVTYSPLTHPQFVETLDRTYVGSLDCPALTGVRETPDVLAAHQAAGVFDPRLWLLALHEQKPVGILLLSQVLSRPALEVVYMGVVADARGLGVGDALLDCAVTQCRRRGLDHLTLAVDAENTPALNLYARWGFFETARRRAWMAVRPRGPE